MNDIEAMSEARAIAIYEAVHDDTAKRTPWASLPTGEWEKWRRAANVMQPPKEAKTCVWTKDFEGYYDTACGEAFVFNDGTPKENNAYFCHHCGGKLEVKS